MMHILFITIFMVCTITSEKVDMDCYWDTNYINGMDGNHYRIQDHHLFAGQQSYHHNHFEDRRFKWKYCKPTFPEEQFHTFWGPRSNEMAETNWDEEWVRTCRNFNGGDAAIHGIESRHSNHYEDRKWTIHCGHLDRSIYRLSDCRWTSNYINNWDASINYQCPNDGVMRSIESVHHNHYEDRRYKFECCALNKIDYQFTDIQGEWISKCSGCSQHTFTESFGTARSTQSSTTTNFAWQLSVEVSAGFSFMFASGSMTISGSVARSVERTMSTAFSTTSSQSMTLECDKDFFYQFVMHGYESSVDGNGLFNSYSNRFICTDSPTPPQCVPGQCGADEMFG